jgi:hypothetical protein
MLLIPVVIARLCIIRNELVEIAGLERFSRAM